MIKGSFHQEKDTISINTYTCGLLTFAPAKGIYVLIYVSCECYLLWHTLFYNDLITLFRYNILRDLEIGRLS